MSKKNKRILCVSALQGNYFDYLQQMHEFTQNNPDVPVMHMSFEDMKKVSVTGT